MYPILIKFTDSGKYQRIMNANAMPLGVSFTIVLTHAYDNVINAFKEGYKQAWAPIEVSDEYGFESVSVPMSLTDDASNLNWNDDFYDYASPEDVTYDSQSENSNSGGSVTYDPFDYNW